MTAPAPTFSQTINTSTRHLHTKLNQTILRLLPLALPPNTLTPHLYAHGMSPILEIYSAFESAFTSLLAIPHSDRSTVHAAIATLHIPSLERATRLKSDISRLLDPPISEKSSARPPLHPMGLHLSAFISHITTHLPEHPHLILAYTHAFYLALFSGGRYIHAQLRNSGHREFRNDDSLRFWTFEYAGEDGEEGLKWEFKQRFEDVAAQLGERERGEIMKECGWIMQALREVVEEIAAGVGKEGEMVGNVEVKDREASVNEEDALRVRREWEGLNVRWIMMLKHLLPIGLAELILGGWWWAKYGEVPYFSKGVDAGG